MLASLKNKVALITGAGSGIGRATAEAFGKAGSKVVVADVNVEGGHETVATITAAGGDAIFIRTDVTKAADVAALVAGTVDKYGRLDIAFNNAGIEGETTRIDQCEEATFDRIINVNLKGVWLCLREELRQFLKQGGGGAIVNMSSTAGIMGFQSINSYVAAKHGVVGLTRAAALEYAKDNIRVNAMCPGGVLTPLVQAFMDADPSRGEGAFADLHPMGRMGKVEEIAAAVLFLSSDEAGFLTGVPLPVDGGANAR
jgi:NAD(P)-dependent dehydrogenase (short-subunit alcohol dehydrogenase family)